MHKTAQGNFTAFAVRGRRGSVTKWKSISLLSIIYVLNKYFEIYCVNGIYIKEVYTMVGKYHIVVENAYLKYEFDISRNITVIRGNSATGKTTLIEMIRAYNEQEDTGISVICPVPTVVVYGRGWAEQIANTSHSIIFIDEQSRFVKSKEFAEAIKGSDNYYVIVTREKLSELPYSITEIYGIRTSGRYVSLVGEYTSNEFFRIYGDVPFEAFKPDVMIMEDSDSGYDFWKYVSKKCECISAEGKSNIIKRLRSLTLSDKNYLVIADGAAFGPDIEELMQYIQFNNRRVKLFAPESFEYLLLSSGLFKTDEIKKMCESTSEYADSRLYMSWEQFYTDLITRVTMSTEMQYSKRKLSIYYLSQRNIDLVLKEVPENLIIT